MKKSMCSNVDNISAWTRRDLLKALLAGSIAAFSGILLYKMWLRREQKAETFIASVSKYDADLKAIIMSALKELGISPSLINQKHVLLKPNLVEPHSQRAHINTHPLIIRGAAEAFLALGASKVIVAEGAGHQRDSLFVLEESGVADVLFEDKIPFIDLNNDSLARVKNVGKKSMLKQLYLPETVLKADLVVSLAKMKTHHWAGATLSMKNMFGIMPGSIYGWPKNVLHWAGLQQSIYDINATVKPHFAIVDGIVGMEGDGPIMGDPVSSNVIVLGTNALSVDATCCRIMGINPIKLSYLKYSSGSIGTIMEDNIHQRGENIRSVGHKYRLLDFIKAHKGIRLL